jgi:hypothetical protein
VFLTFAYTPILARIIHVPADSSTIQSGINGAADGDTVLVARGHYYERINFYGKAILVASNFIFDSDTTTIDSTIIDADTLILGVADTGSVVVFVSGEDSTSIIQGFTMQNGIGTLTTPGGAIYYRYGGGIYCNFSSPTIKNNVIAKNYTIFTLYRGGQGGGISCLHSFCIISNNIISKNDGSFGGGIHCWKAFPYIINNTITENSSGMGGGIGFNSSSPVINNNIISENSASDEGGGIHCQWQSAPIICNNIIIGNSGSGYGGGIDCWWDCGGLISNNIIADNSAAQGGGIRCSEASPTIINNTIIRNSSNGSGSGIICEYKSYPVITNNIISNNLNGVGLCCTGLQFTISNNDFWNNTDSNFINCKMGIGDTTWGTNINGIPCDSFYNILIDPLFGDTLNDFHLKEGSPCIDAGDNSVAPDSDLDGNTRIVDGNEDDSAVVDLGAYEYQPSVGIAEELKTFSTGDFVIFQNYPNPFNPQTTIEYYLPRSGWVNLAIYNVLGQKIKVLVNDFQTKGKKSITWDGKDQKGKMVATGIYYYRLRTSDYIDSKKMLLIK